jgi:hypothetical protein
MLSVLVRALSQVTRAASQKSFGTPVSTDNWTPSQAELAPDAREPPAGAARRSDRGTSGSDFCLAGRPVSDGNQGWVRVMTEL